MPQSSRRRRSTSVGNCCCGAGDRCIAANGRSLIEMSASAGLEGAGGRCGRRAPGHRPPDRAARSACRSFARFARDRRASRTASSECIEQRRAAGTRPKPADELSHDAEAPTRGIGLKHCRRPGRPNDSRGRRDRYAAAPAVRRADHPSASASRPTGSSTNFRARRTRRPMPTFEKTPGWLDWYSRPQQAAVHAAARRGRRALPRVRPRRRVSVRARAQVHALRREQGAALRAARPPRLRAQRDRAGHLPRRRQPRDGRRAAAPSGRARGVATVRRERHRRASCASCTRPACAACASTSSGAWSTSRPATSWWRSPGASAARLARRRLLRGARTCPSCGTSSPRCRPRSSSTTWAGPTSRKPVDGPEFELFLRLHARARRTSGPR